MKNGYKIDLEVIIIITITSLKIYNKNVLNGFKIYILTRWE